MSTRISAAKRRKVIALIQGGQHGRNAVAAETGVGAATVTKIAQEEGLSFDRTATKEATEARQADSRARRADTASRLLTKANELLDQMDRPHVAFSFGGKDNIYNQHEFDKPPTNDLRNLMQTASTALQRHMDLERHDADEKAADARSMLTELGRALGVQQPDA